MGVFSRYCIKCMGYTNHSIEFDPDSNEGEPDFIEICMRCEGKDAEIIKELPKGQTTL